MACCLAIQVSHLWQRTIVFNAVAIPTFPSVKTLTLVTIKYMLTSTMYAWITATKLDLVLKNIETL